MAMMVQVVLNTGAQLLLKYGMIKVNITHFAWQWEVISPILLQVIASPFIILGCACYVLSMVLCLAILSKVQVSVAYPIGSLGYVLGAFAASYLLGEHLTPAQWLGISIIIIGVFLLVRDM